MARIRKIEMKNAAKQVFRLDFCGYGPTVETDEVIGQAGGTVLIRYDSTVVLSAVTVSKQAGEGIDFLPLTVLFEEELYSAGKIPGGFLHREEGPGEYVTLTARMIDRPIRPLLADGFRNEVQVVNTVLSVDQGCIPEMTVAFGAFLAPRVSDVPFNGPITGVMVGRVDGEYIISPTLEQLGKSDINLTAADTKYVANVIESGAKEVSEEAMLGAIMFGHGHVKQLVAFQEEIAAAVGREKMEVKLHTVDKDIDREVCMQFEQAIRDVMSIEKKLERCGRIDELTEKAVAVFGAKKYENEAAKIKVLKQVRQICHSIEADEARRSIIEDKVCPDSRRVDEIRPLDSQVDILPRAHGNVLFTRGRTQVSSVTTLGSMNDNQIIDNPTGMEAKRFMHHYNFSPYSVGETGRMEGSGRREVGHDALGERVLSQVLSSVEDFPYTVRTAAEVTEFSGPSFQASIRARTMSLTTADVPVKVSVVGTAMGLIMDEENGKYTVLADIQGMKGRFGDMDLKVAGTSKGITALQMDIKVTGITREIFEKALTQAKVARTQILESMMAAISEPREDVGVYTPKTEQSYIGPERIHEVIGPNGKMISKIIETSNDVKIDTEDNGHVVIYHMDYATINYTADMARDIVWETEVGGIYGGKVVRIEKFGAFVSLFPGMDGPLHISKINHERVNKMEDILDIGDTVHIKATEIDGCGRANVGAKALLPKPRTKKKEEDAKPAAAVEDNKEA